MKTSVSRTWLIDTLKSNREKHRDEFERAFKAYSERCVKELEEMLSLAKRGKPFRVSVGLTRPVNETRAYDRVIGMLEQHTEVAEDAIELDEEDWQKYVQDLDFQLQEQHQRLRRRAASGGVAALRLDPTFTAVCGSYEESREHPGWYWVNARNCEAFGILPGVLISIAASGIVETRRVWEKFDPATERLDGYDLRDRVPRCRRGPSSSIADEAPEATAGRLVEVLVPASAADLERLRAAVAAAAKFAPRQTYGL